MNTAAKEHESVPNAASSSASPSKRRPLRWFIAAPARMALDPGLSHPAFRLASILLHYESGDRRCFPAQRTLARHLGCSLDTIQRYLEELERYGFLGREKTRGVSNQYLLTPRYEPPIPHDSVEVTGTLEAENMAPRRPPPAKALRNRLPFGSSNATETAIHNQPNAIDIAQKTKKTQQPEVPAPLPSDSGVSASTVAAPVRLLPVVPRSELAAPVRPVLAASVPEHQPHRCGPNKNQYIKNQQQEIAAAEITDAEKDAKIGHLEIALEREGVPQGDAVTWATSLYDLELTDVLAATRILFTKPAYKRAEIRAPAAYLRTLCKTVVAADRRLVEHEELKHSGSSVPGATAMEIFATLNRDDRERVVDRARSFAEPNATLWPMAVAIALNALRLTNTGAEKPYNHEAKRRLHFE